MRSGGTRHSLPSECLAVPRRNSGIVLFFIPFRKVGEGDASFPPFTPVHYPSFERWAFEFSGFWGTSFFLAFVHSGVRGWDTSCAAAGAPEELHESPVPPWTCRTGRK